MNKVIDIIRDNDHGRRIVCTCGFQDKSYPKDAKSCAARHNNTEHRGKYHVRNCDDNKSLEIPS